MILLTKFYLCINPYNERQQGDQKLFGIASEFKGGCRGQQKIHDSTHVDSLTVHWDKLKLTVSVTHVTQSKFGYVLHGSFFNWFPKKHFDQWAFEKVNPFLLLV